MQKNNTKSKLIIMAIAATVLLVAGILAVAYALNLPVAKPELASQTAPEKADLVGSKIIFEDGGFSQDSYTFKEGTTVYIENQSSKTLQFLAGDNPTNTDEPNPNVLTIPAGVTVNLMPPGKGTYGFRDQLNDQFSGTLIIK